MKKLIIAACMFFGFVGIASAQKIGTADAKQKHKTEKSSVVKKDKPAIAKPANMTKSDGTPDMRFKANKEKKVPAKGPVKKDGTLDKRYKANKTK